MSLAFIHEADDSVKSESNVFVCTTCAKAEQSFWKSRFVYNRLFIFRHTHSELIMENDLRNA